MCHCSVSTCFLGVFFSRGAAQEHSPRREPWEPNDDEITSPGGAKDLTRGLQLNALDQSEVLVEKLRAAKFPHVEAAQRGQRVEL